jgi:probable HAF family extracellular repeat protein
MAPAYSVTDLGTLGGSPHQSHGYGINNCGTTVGDSVSSGGITHPFYKKGVTMIDLGGLGGDGVAYSVNSSGYTVGYSTSQIQRAFLWHDDNGNGISDPGEFKDFLPVGATGVAYEINDSNRVVGIMDSSGGQNLSDTPFVWDAINGVQSLPTPPAGISPLRAIGINNAGTIAGWAAVSFGTHAFVLKNNTYIDLGTLDNATSTVSSFSERISEDGHVVGYSQTASNNLTLPFHPFVWFDANANNTSDAGEMKDLGTLSGTNAFAYDVNASGFVVGTSEVTGGGTHAYVWHDDNANGVSDPGEMKDLNGQISDAAWTTLVEARAINDGGQIVGWGTMSNGETHAFLLTPTGFTPPPCPGASPTPTPAPPAATSLISVQGSGTVGSTATLSATLFSNDMPVSGKTISFTLNSTAVCGGTGVTCPVTNASGIATLSGVSLSGIDAGNYPGAVGASFAGDSNFGSTSQTGLLSVTPFLLLENGTNNAAAVDSVTFVRGPFRVPDDFNFSGDHITRIIIFTSPLANPEPTLKVFASGHQLPVENFGTLTGVPGLNVSYIIVKLDPILTGSGPINYDLSVSFRGVTSNTATLTIIP